jgi:hypothetical protein
MGQLNADRMQFWHLHARDTEKQISQFATSLALWRGQDLEKSRESIGELGLANITVL